MWLWNMHCFWYFPEHHQTVGNSSNTVDSKSRVQANLTFIAQTNGGSQVHIAERYTGSRNYKKSCVYCRSIGVTTNSGRTVETQWKCEQCGVALCIGKRNCFTLFHENLVQNEQEWLQKGCVWECWYQSRYFLMIVNLPRSWLKIEE